MTSAPHIMIESLSPQRHMTTRDGCWETNPFSKRRLMNKPRARPSHHSLRQLRHADELCEMAIFNKIELRHLGSQNRHLMRKSPNPSRATLQLALTTSRDAQNASFKSPRPSCDMSSQVKHLQFGSSSSASKAHIT